MHHDSKIPRKTRWVALILALLWAALIFVLSSIPGQNYPEHPGFLNYLAHAGEYLVLAALIYVAVFNGKTKAAKLALIAIVVAAAYAASDELHQLFVANRSSDIVDWFCDLGGATFGTLLAMLYVRFRR